jgi:hypothetical protein
MHLCITSNFAEFREINTFYLNKLETTRHVLLIFLTPICSLCQLVSELVIFFYLTKIGWRGRFCKQVVAAGYEQKYIFKTYVY